MTLRVRSRRTPGLSRFFFSFFFPPSGETRVLAVDHGGRILVA